jgi:hypothetical protein
MKTVRNNRGMGLRRAQSSRVSSIAAIFLFAMASTSCNAQTTPPPMINPVGSTDDGSIALRPDATIDDVLDTLQTRGQNLKEFVADVKLTESDTVMGTSTIRLGKVWYQLRDNGDARFHVRFDKKGTGDKPPVDDVKEYLLNDGWLIDRDYRAKTETNRQVARPGEKVNLFQLGKGPFPLPIGQDKKDVHAQFDITKVPLAKDEPTNTVHLQLKPKPGTDLERKFSTIDVWVDQKTGMPVRIETLDRNQTTDRTTDLDNLKVNPKPGLNDADFTLPPIDNGGWNRHDEPLNQ